MRALVDGFDMAEENARILAYQPRYDLPPETPEQTAALDWVSGLVRRLPTFPTRAQLAAAWNDQDAQQQRTYLKTNRPHTLAALVDLVTQRRDQLSA